MIRIYFHRFALFIFYLLLGPILRGGKLTISDSFSVKDLITVLAVGLSEEWFFVDGF